MKHLQRDFHIGSASQKTRLFYRRPLREFIKWGFLLVEVMAYRCVRSLYTSWKTRRLLKESAHPRRVEEGVSRHFIPGPSYVEIQIGNETRANAVLQEGDFFSFERTIQTGDDFLFGVAPLIPELDPQSSKKWKFSVRVEEIGTDQVWLYEGSLPYDGKTEEFVYFPGDGWLDVQFPLQEFVGKKCRISVQGTTALGISCPQILKKRPEKEARTVVLISGESLTNLDYLRRVYGFSKYPHLEALIQEGVSYPYAYSPTDATLSFVAAVLTGLLPSQHGIGYYGWAADSFDNKRFSEKVTPLAQFFKELGFFTICGGTTVRLSSKMGWAKGFDHFFHVFDK